MPITFITLKMVFVLAWTTGDASSLSHEFMTYHVHFVYNSMSSSVLVMHTFSTCGVLWVFRELLDGLLMSNFHLPKMERFHYILKTRILA
jgi:hypothetical protein